ncbi:MAG: hypothetical protein LBT98_02295 [Puniceicoccales bacterium]|jgi:hypothetical protein|nr:hypothetical protein [Puniceicoccales bacterium]
MQNLIFSNVADGTHAGSCTLTAGEALPRRHLLVALAGEAGTVKVAGAADLPIGTVDDEAVAGDPIAVQFLGGGRTLTMVAAEPIPQGAELAVGAGGKVQALATAAGSYVQVGLALAGAVAEGEPLEVLSRFPQKLTIAS